MRDNNVISVNRLTKYYGKHLGINELSFVVGRGEVFGFLGPNGAGKTTTIRLLLDLIHPTSGNISLFGQQLPEHSMEIRKRCGYLPGDFNPYGSMTVTDFLNFAANLRNIHHSFQDELVDLFSLDKHLEKKIKHLSHGNRQKLGLVQAFFHDPELIILDEPTSGLDPLIQDKFYEFIMEQRDLGKTIFFSSHNLPEVEKICQRIAIIRDGSLVALETISALKRKTYRRMQLSLKQPVADLHIPGATLIKHKDLTYEFIIKADVQSVLKTILKLPVADITLPPPDLEEIFMYFYKGQSGV